MKIKIIEHKKKYFFNYQQFIFKLTEIHGKLIDTHHIGSSSVTGLGGKGVIDILIGVKNWQHANEIINSLKKLV